MWHSMDCTRCVGHLFKPHLLYHISTLELEAFWNWLPEKHRNDLEIQQALPCREHYPNDSPTAREHIDGPPPRRSNCIGCRNGK